MKIAVVFNRESREVINRFGKQNREKYDEKTIERIQQALIGGGHDVAVFEGDKHIIAALESFLPRMDRGEDPGFVFNLSYGIQGRARYTHMPAILEMLGIPYVGSGPLTHAIALDKILTKKILLHHGLPTPKFRMFEVCGERILLENEFEYPLIVKPRDEAVSFGLHIAHNDQELIQGVDWIRNNFQTDALVEEFIKGREINVGIIGNDPGECLPVCEILIPEGDPVYTFEDKKGLSGRNIRKSIPANLEKNLELVLSDLALKAFHALGCSDAARVDFRLNEKNEPTILEVNSMPSMSPIGSYVMAAAHRGLDFDQLVNRLVDIAYARYFPNGRKTISTKYDIIG